MNRHHNQRTQPKEAMPVFDNWGVVAKGWYFALAARELPVGQARSLEIAGQHLVLWRGADGRARAADGYCPHMGTDLGIGRVEGDELRCFFHHWRFDETGACTDVPCGQPAPKSARLRPWATAEAYGLVWVYPEAEAPGPFPMHEELEGQELTWVHGPAYHRACHHHVTMINGIDPQHLRTVHGLDVEMELELREDAGPGVVDYTLRGALTGWARRILGPTYAYRMRYAHGTIGFLSVMKETRIFGGARPWPELYMLFAYRPEAPGRTRVQPVYVARRGRGLLGRLASRALVTMMWLGFLLLRDEDGQVYENMRFRPAALLPMDKPVAKFIQWVNKLEPSEWAPARLEV